MSSARLFPAPSRLIGFSAISHETTVTGRVVSPVSVRAVSGGDDVCSGSVTPAVSGSPVTVTGTVTITFSAGSVT